MNITIPNKQKLNICIVAGTFDENGGKPSGLMTKFYQSLNQAIKQNTTNTGTLTMYNGGLINKLSYILEYSGSLDTADVIIWTANVPNSYPKIIQQVKQLYPKALLVTSKRNRSSQYNFKELVNHALGVKANLTIEISNIDDKFVMHLFDPLGNTWCKPTTDIDTLTMALCKRLFKLKTFTRERTHSVSPILLCPNGLNNISKINPEFIDIIQSSADIFHHLIAPASGVNRFLGNASCREENNFRCTHGFPSMRESGNQIRVTRRNIDKRQLTSENFVIVQRGIDGRINYAGEHKPSVDTPVQLALYETFKNINYMLHAHVYIQDAPFTQSVIPCGALEEIDEIIQAINDPSVNHFALNLKGHGCLIAGKSVNDIVPYLSKFTARVLPESLD